MSLEEKVWSDECGSLPVSSKPRKSSPKKSKPRKKTVYAIRDFPVNCGSAKTLSFQDQENSKLQGSLDDPKSTHTTEEFGSEPETKVELLPSFPQDASDNASLLSPSKTNVCEITTLRNEVQQRATKVPPPGRKISANRTFPRGCGRNALQANHQVAPEFTVLKTSELDQNIAKREETRESEHQKNVSSTNGGKNMFHSRSISSGMKKGKMQENDKNKRLDGKSSEHISMNSSQRKALPSSELPGHRIIVQALMAAPNCPWRNGKRGKIKLNKH